MLRSLKKASVYGKGGGAGKSIGEVNGARVRWGQIMQGLLGHGKEFRLHILHAMGRHGRVLSRGVIRGICFKKPTRAALWRMPCRDQEWR